MTCVVARLRFHLTIARSPIDAGGVFGGAAIGGCWTVSVETVTGGVVGGVVATALVVRAFFAARS